MGVTNYRLSQTTPPAMELTKVHYNRLPDLGTHPDLQQFCVSSNRFRELPHNIGAFGVVCVCAFVCVCVCVCVCVFCVCVFSLERLMGKGGARRARRSKHEESKGIDICTI